MEPRTAKSDEQNYYEILEVSAEAPHHEIVAAYERAKSTYSPDSPSLYTMFSEEEANQLRRLIEEAYVILSNQAKRREYDNVLKARTMLQPKPEELPDLRVVDQKTEKKDPPPTVSASGAVPTGFLKSRVSVYEANPQFETEIANAKEFDGEYLKKIRQYKNITIEQMSKETRISRSYLAAVEANDYEALPAPVFARGFVVQVARLLNLDDNAVAQSYMSKFKKK
ncbi:MAG: helix-turn-helix domain-containing protein [Bdellovibrionota bacterium]